MLASVGPGGANTSAGIAAVSKDGKKMFFETGDALVAEDSDGLCDREGYDYYGEPFPPSPCVDLYVRDLAAGTTELVSTGPAGGAGHFDARFPVIARRAVSEDGNRVFFVTAEPLVSEDADDRSDVYQRDLAAGATRLISTGPVDPGLFDASFGGASIDGSQAFFYTAERLVTEDTDSNQDFYQRAGDKTILSRSARTAATDHGTQAACRGRPGSRVLVATREALLAEDTDDCASALIRGPCSDVYARDHATGSLELVSTGPHGDQDSYGVQAWGASSDGRRVFFTTAEPLVDEDVEANCPAHDGLGEVGCVDIYERDLASDTTKLISTGPKETGVDGSGIPKGTRDDATFRYATPDGDRIFFHTEEQLVDADTDNGPDVTSAAGGTTTLLSASGTGGNSENDSGFMGSSTDGTIVYIGTYDALLPEDTDGHFDTYERSGGEFRLATTGPAGGNGAYHAGRPDKPGFARRQAVRLQHRGATRP